MRTRHAHSASSLAAHHEPSTHARVPRTLALDSGGNWGPTVDGFTAPMSGAADGAPQDEAGGAARGAAGEAEGRPTGIGHFFGALRIGALSDAACAL